MRRSRTEPTRQIQLGLSAREQVGRSADGTANARLPDGFLGGDRVPNFRSAYPQRLAM